MKKVLSIFTASLLLFSVLFTVLPEREAKANSNSMFLQDLGATSVTNSGYVRYNKFNNGPFEDNAGIQYLKGIGVASGYYRFELEYNLKNYNFDTFEASIGIQKALGDYGKTTIHIFADNVEIYKKAFIFSTPTDDVSLKLPENIEKLELVITNIAGAKGTNDVFFGDARVSTKGQPSPSQPKVYTLDDIGAYQLTNSGYYRQDRFNNSPFVDNDGNAYGSGIGIASGYYAYDATYNVKNYGVKRFEGMLCTQYKDGGDYGKVSVSIHADNEQLYQIVLNGTESAKEFSLEIPEGTNNITISTRSTSGAKGTHDVFIGNDSLIVNDDIARPVLSMLNIYEIGGKYTNSGYVSSNRFSSTPFVDFSGNFYPIGIGIQSGYNQFESTYSLLNYPYDVFQSKIGLQQKTGDYGAVTFTVYADNQKLIERRLDSKNPTANIGVKIPEGTKELKLLNTYTKGTSGTYSVFWANPFLSNGFTDVSYDFWAFNEISYLQGKSVIGGYQDGTFRPNNNLTRSQAALMVTRALGLDTRNVKDPGLKDITSTDNAYAAIAAVMEEGLFSDFVNREFKPNQFLTRGEMASILVKAFELSGNGATTFKDTTNHWAKQHISLLAENNITTGYDDNTFRPENLLSRAQFSVFFARATHENFK